VSVGILTRGIFKSLPGWVSTKNIRGVERLGEKRGEEKRREEI
jgi:hypothetical protein